MQIRMGGKNAESPRSGRWIGVCSGGLQKAEKGIRDFPAGWNEGCPPPRSASDCQADLLLTEGFHGGKELFVRCIGAEGLLLAVIQLNVQPFSVR